VARGVAQLVAGRVSNKAWQIKSLEVRPCGSATLCARLRVRSCRGAYSCDIEPRVVLL